MSKESLLDQILDRDNMNRAYKQVKRNKGSAGVDGMTVDELGVFLRKHKEEITQAI